MLRGKTKRGILIRSTVGMPETNHAKTWILVADRSRLCLFEKIRGGTTELKEEFTPAEEVPVTARLVKKAEAIARRCAALGQATFAVVAEPRLMGKLRPALDRALGKLRPQFHERDLAWLPAAQLKDRISSLVS